jgi:hypothetical protein
VSTPHSDDLLDSQETRVVPDRQEVRHCTLDEQEISVEQRIYSRISAPIKISELET